MSGEYSESLQRLPPTPNPSILLVLAGVLFCLPEPALMAWGFFCLFFFRAPITCSRATFSQVQVHACVGLTEALIVLRHWMLLSFSLKHSINICVPCSLLSVSGPWLIPLILLCSLFHICLSLHPFYFTFKNALGECRQVTQVRIWSQDAEGFCQSIYTLQFFRNIP